MAYGLKHIAVCLLVAASLCLAHPSYAQSMVGQEPASAPVAAPQDNIFQRLYEKLIMPLLPKKDEGPDPSKTLQAPFSTQTDKMSPTAESMNLPYAPPGQSGEGSNMAIPHRQEEQIAEWLAQVLSESMNLDPKKYQTHMAKLRPMMDQTGLAAYDRFLKETNILEQLTSSGYVLRSFVEEKPFLVNEGVVADRYRWLFETPMTLSFLPAHTGTNYYSKADNPLNYHVIVTTQIGRIDSGEDGIIIEDWKVRKNTAQPASSGKK